MTEQEAIKFLTGYLDSVVYKEKCVETHKLAIKALEEIQQYREIGTPDECRAAVKFKEYFDELYGTDLEVANWHKNGDTEPFDNFYESALDEVMKSEQIN